MGNHIQKFFAAIADSNKFIQQSAFGIDYREIALMFTHGGNDGFLRQGQEFFFKFSAQSRRIFNEVIDLFQKILIDFSNAAFSCCQFGHLLANQLTAGILIDQYEVISQCLHISISIWYFHSALHPHNGGMHDIADFIESRAQQAFVLYSVFHRLLHKTVPH